MWLPFESIGRQDYMDSVPAMLDDVRIVHKQATNKTSICGSAFGFRVLVNESGLRMQGSLCKSYLGDNFNTLTRQCTQRGIEQLADLLSLPIPNASIKRIDFAGNLLVCHPPNSIIHI